MPVRADDLNVHVILYNAQYHTHALISDFAKEKISEPLRVIAGEPEATLLETTSMFLSCFHGAQ